MTIYSGFPHGKWWFSKAMLVYQRVVHWTSTFQGDERFNPVLLWSPWPDDLLTWPNQKPSHRCKNARSIYDHSGICGDGFDTFLTNHLWSVESFVKICKHHPQMVGASLGFPRWAETKQSDPLSLSPSSSTKGVRLNSCKPCARGGLLWEVERRKKPGTCGENDGTL